MEGTGNVAKSTRRRPSGILLHKSLPPALVQKIETYRNDPEAFEALEQRVEAYTSSKLTVHSSSLKPSGTTSHDHILNNVEHVTPWPTIGALSNLRQLVVDVELDVCCAGPGSRQVISSRHRPGSGQGCSILSPCSHSRPQSPAAAQRQQVRPCSPKGVPSTTCLQQPTSPTKPPTAARQSPNYHRPGSAGASAGSPRFAGTSSPVGATSVGSPRPRPSSAAPTTGRHAAAAQAQGCPYQASDRAGRLVSPSSRPASATAAAVGGSGSISSGVAARGPIYTAGAQAGVGGRPAVGSRPASATPATKPPPPPAAAVRRSPSPPPAGIVAAAGTRVVGSPPRSRPASAAPYGGGHHTAVHPARGRPQSAASVVRTPSAGPDLWRDNSGWYEDDGSGDSSEGDGDHFNAAIRHQLAAQVVTRKVERQQRSQEVNQRRLEAEAAAAERLEVLRHKDEVREAAREAAARQAAWEARQRESFMAYGAVVRTITIVRGVAAAIQDARRARVQRDREKAAARLIASSYKVHMLHKHQHELSRLIQRSQPLLLPYVARMLIAARRRAARRMVHFLQLTQTTCPVAVAVAQFIRRVMFIQRHWKAMVRIRAAQHELLYRQLLRLEEQTAARNAQHTAAGGLRVRAITSLGGAEFKAAVAAAGATGLNSPAARVEHHPGGLRSSTAGVAGAPGAGVASPVDGQEGAGGGQAAASNAAASNTKGTGPSTATKAGSKGVFKPGGKAGAAAAKKASAKKQAGTTAAAGVDAGSGKGTGAEAAAGGPTRPGSAGKQSSSVVTGTPGASGHAAASALHLPAGAGPGDSSHPVSSPTCRKRLAVVLPSDAAGAADGDPQDAAWEARSTAPHTPGHGLPTKTPKGGSSHAAAAPGSTATCSTPGPLTGKGRFGCNSTRGKRVGMMVDGCDLKVEARLRELLEVLPADIRQEVVQRTLQGERQKLCQLKEQYRSAVRRYTAALPLENVRMQQLQGAGLPATSDLRAPVRPRMHLILPQAQLKELIVQGMDLIHTRTAGWGTAEAAPTTATASVRRLHF